MLTKKHLIAGAWTGSEATFANAPVSGEPEMFPVGTAADVDAACRASEDAFAAISRTSRADRAALLYTIAEEIETRGTDVTTIGCRETGLPEARLEGERGRTTGQLRMFARHIEQGDYLDRRHDEALPDRQPLPRPNLRVIQRPTGPVALFGASNFPLAFSVAGGDTASALAAGCPVVFKGHEAHPGTCEIVAQAIQAAIERTDMHPGVFSLIQGDDRAIGQALVMHPLIRAVGFTGSLAGGRALYNMCAQRPEPIPFYGELGSINPMFVLPNALKTRGRDIGGSWAASLTLGAGQFCTNPGAAFVIEGSEAEAFVAATTEALAQAGSQTMLTEGIADAYRSGRDRIADVTGTSSLSTLDSDRRNTSPYLFETNGATWLANPVLAEEVFGPLGLVVKVADEREILSAARSLQGQLTCTLHLDTADEDLAAALMPVIERKAGRLIANGFPTGVEVCDAMVHSGPFPASTNFGHTSVGTLAIRRWLRPVCYQDVPKALLPADLRNAG
ncbi:aldehyde dehydrogenase (NADP(+)) [Boseongicola sp. H5]|uniref:aldehyde dehydrogenase (NADP(+)) n=1 Tax=Boseongicola sp. H5 TaxID=2763261 RepID=UPI001B01A3D3|nr:aldehyde dehydrogenase (NADP(+)) [Boseongicola sp. H5]MBO6921976.1 aldehyde dehydrogenase (NADP(+)) [Roseicyclus sp.]